MYPHALGAETAQVEVEVAMDRHQLADFDAGGDAAFAHPLRRPETGGVVVARDVEAGEGRGQIRLGELVMILDLHQQGLSVSVIARPLECDRKTVRKYIERGLQTPARASRERAW